MLSLRKNVNPAQMSKMWRGDLLLLPLISGGGGNHNNNNTAADDAVGRRVMCKHKAPPQLPPLRWPLKAFHRV